MPDHLDAVRRLFDAVVVRSPLEYTLAGRTWNVASFGAGHHPMWGTYTAGQPPLVQDLQMRIYDEAYCRPLGTRPDPPSHPPSLIEPLSAANVGRERWESGWTLVQVLQNGYAMARKGDRAQMFGPGHFAAAYGAQPVAGAAVNVFFARESRSEQPGFYIVFGEAPMPEGSDSRMTRIYWHIGEAGAVPLTAAVSTLLNRFEVPFRFKTLSYGGAYSRADAAVLFFPTRYFQVVAKLLPRIRAEVKDHLREATPLMTRKLGDGIGLAEDPANGESFGMHRTRMLAQAIWDAYARGMQSDDARMQELAIQFQRHGLSLDRPHLRAASADIYAS